jgi:hypothetical protein
VSTEEVELTASPLRGLSTLDVWQGRRFLGSVEHVRSQVDGLLWYATNATCSYVGHAKDRDAAVALLVTEAGRKAVGK